VETSRLAPASSKTISDLCLQIYRQHTERGLGRVRELEGAVKKRNEDALLQAMKALHKHNRQTMRISKTFEEDVADTLLTLMRSHPLGKESARIGQVIPSSRPYVEMKTPWGGRRLVDWLMGEHLPRIC
jgi:hypothetical protein